VERGEEGVVEAAAGVVVGADVEPVTVFEQFECDCEAFVEECCAISGSCLEAALWTRAGHA
jgi:hypothetical protein